MVDKSSGCAGPVFHAITDGGHLNDQTNKILKSAQDVVSPVGSVAVKCTDYGCNKTEPCGHKRCGFPGAGE